MNNYDDKRSIVWSACDCDDPEKCATSDRVGQDDSQAAAEEHARGIGYPFVVGYSLITYPDGECEFDEDAEPIFVRVRGVRLLTAAELAKRFDVRLKCLTCSFTKILSSRREAMVARDVHEFEHGEDGNRRAKHPVCVQVRNESRKGRWLTLTCDFYLDFESEEGTTIEYPKPEDYGTTAVSIGQ